MRFYFSFPIIRTQQLDHERDVVPCDTLHVSINSTATSTLEISSIKTHLGATLESNQPGAQGDLDPEEKARLLRKARKLRQVFGEMPSFEAITLGDSGASGQVSLWAGCDSHIGVVGSSDRRPAHPFSRLLPASLTLFSISLPSPANFRLRPAHRLRLLLAKTASEDLLSSTTNPPLIGVDLLDPPEFSSHDGQSIVIRRAELEVMPEQPSALLCPGGPEGPVTFMWRKKMNIRPFLLGGSEARMPPDDRRRTQRAQSVSFRKQERESVDLAISRREFKQRYYFTFWEESNISEKQRFQHVKKARKIARIFGEDPPIGLVLSPHTGSRMPETLITGTVPATLRKRQSCPNVRDIYDLLNSPAEPFPGLEVSASEDLINSTFDRKQRAIKLSRFFGVDYQEIHPSIVCAPESAIPVPKEVLQTLSQGGVDIRIDRRRFWGLGGSQKQVNDTNMNEVIHQLRGLRAS